MRFLAPLAAALTLALGLGLDARAQESTLPDIGSSAGELLSPMQQRAYGAMTLRELRRYNYLLEDPLLDGWLQGLGYRLASNSDEPKQEFTFFLLGERQINAFATLGGYIGMNSGLILTADSEDEVAAVLSHEIAHVTQRHVLRAVERAQKDQIPIMLGMLGAIIAAQQAGGNSSGNATQAAIASGMALMQQRQIDYTRSNEHEADRLGIYTLDRAGYDPLAMAGFFGRMERALRGNSGGYDVPEFLRSHPVTSTRISEAKDRAERLLRSRRGGNACVLTPDGEVVECARSQAEELQFATAGPINPLLPEELAIGLDPAAAAREAGLFDLARERLRVLSADSPGAAVAEYERLSKGDTGSLSTAQRYGLALARTRMGRGAQAATELEALLKQQPGQHWMELTLAEAEHQAGRIEAAEARYESLLRRLPNSRAVSLSYAQSLVAQGTSAAGRRAQAVLRPLLTDSSGDPGFQRTFARASELAGDLVRAGEAHAETAFLNGRAEDALNQLEALKKRDDLDYYQRSRIDARIAAITPIVLEMRRQGLRPGDQGFAEN